MLTWIFNDGVILYSGVLLSLLYFISCANVAFCRVIGGRLTGQ